MDESRRMIIITGPTSSGKSALAVETALRLGTEIISADSRQVFREIPVVTASPTPEQLAAVPHHLVNFLDLSDYYSASRFEEDALRIAEDIWAGGRRDVVVCGGSMLYVDALCHGLDALPEVPGAIREGLKSELLEKGEEWLLEELERLDPDYYREVDRRNIKRVFHAVEIIRASGRPFSELRTGRKVTRPFRIEKYAISLDRQALFDRINGRVWEMLARGLIEEARRVCPLRHLNSLNTVGLKELFAYFDGTWDLDTAVARIQKNTRVYAKKQMTWLKKDEEVRWIGPDFRIT